MKLNVLKIKGLKHSGTYEKIEAHSDGNGLFLIVHPSNSKTWQLRYTFQGRRGKIKIGTRPYPDTSLQLARQLASELRQKMAEGIDPKARKKEKVLFKTIALEWWEEQRINWGDDNTANKVKRGLVKDAFPIIGNLQLNAIDESHIADIMIATVKAGRRSSSEPLLSNIRRIFAKARVRKLTTRNPTQDISLRDIISPKPKIKHRAAITEPKQLGQLMHDIEKWNAGAYSTVQALRLMPHIFLRTKEIREMLWEYVDFEDKLIRIPDTEMKKENAHIVPMSSQVEEMLKEINKMTGYSRFVLPSNRDSSKAMSKNVITNALRSMGYGSDVMSGHGFRSSASTLLHEKDWKHDIVETQLAHLTGSATSRAYNRSKYLSDRKRMMQFWSDYLDDLRSKVKN
jgi:integrase